MKVEIDNMLAAIDDEATKICNMIRNHHEIESDLFMPAIVLDDYIRSTKKAENPLVGKHGVYVFIMTEPVEFTRDQGKAWNEIKGAPLVDSIHPAMNVGDCLYLGSAIGESLHTRIRQHFLDKGTFTALKLRDRRRILVFGKVQVYVFRVKEEYTSEQYKIICPHIERKLHDYLSPKAGMKKT